MCCEPPTISRPCGPGYSARATCGNRTRVPTLATWCLTSRPKSHSGSPAQLPRPRWSVIWLLGWVPHYCRAPIRAGHGSRTHRLPRTKGVYSHVYLSSINAFTFSQSQWDSNPQTWNSRSTKAGTNRPRMPIPPWLPAETSSQVLLAWSRGRESNSLPRVLQTRR